MPRTDVSSQSTSAEPDAGSQPAHVPVTVPAITAARDRKPVRFGLGRPVGTVRARSRYGWGGRDRPEDGRETALRSVRALDGVNGNWPLVRAMALVRVKGAWIASIRISKDNQGQVRLSQYGAQLGATICGWLKI